MTITGSSGARSSETVDAGTTTYSAAVFNAYESFTATVEVRAVSPATAPTTESCSGRTAEGGNIDKIK